MRERERGGGGRQTFILIFILCDEGNDKLHKLNLHTVEELEDLKAKVKVNSRKELQDLVRENRELSKKLESATGMLSKGAKGASVGGDKGGASRGASVVEGRTLTVEEAEDGFDRISISSGRGTLVVYIHIQWL